MCTKDLIFCSLKKHHLITVNHPLTKRNHTTLWIWYSCQYIPVVYIYIYIYICVCVCVCVCVFVCVFVCVWERERECVCVCVCLFVSFTFLSACIYLFWESKCILTVGLLQSLFYNFVEMKMVATFLRLLQRNEKCTNSILMLNVYGKYKISFAQCFYS